MKLKPLIASLEYRQSLLKTERILNGMFLSLQLLLLLFTFKGLSTYFNSSAAFTFAALCLNLFILDYGMYFAAARVKEKVRKLDKDVHDKLNG